MILPHEKTFIQSLINVRKQWHLKDIFANYVRQYPFDFPFSSFVLSRCSDRALNKSIQEILSDKDLLELATSRAASSPEVSYFKFFYGSPYNSFIKFLVSLTRVMWISIDNDRSIYPTITFLYEEDGEYYIRCDLGRNSIIFNSGCKDRRFIVIPNNQVNLTNSDDKVDDMIKKVSYYYSVVLFDENRCHTDNEYYDTLFNWLLDDEYNNDIDGIRPKNLFCSTQPSYLDSFKITNESVNREPISENQLSELDEKQLQMSFI